MGKELIYFRLRHFRRVPDIVKEDESFHPLAVCLFGPATVMARAQGFPQPIEELRFGARQRVSEKSSIGLPVRGYGLIDGSYFEWRSGPGHSFAPKHV